MEGKANQVQYEEFEPLCKWQRRGDLDILEIYVKEFKKEQLELRTSNYGILKISGECPLTMDSSKRTKFYKEVPIPAHKYDAPAINAKFFKGVIYITMPKIKIDQSPKPGLTANHSNGGAPPAQNIAGGPKEEGLATSGGNAPPPLQNIAGGPKDEGLATSGGKAPPPRQNIAGGPKEEGLTTSGGNAPPPPQNIAGGPKEEGLATSGGNAPPPRQNIAGGPKEEGLATSGGNAPPSECEFRSGERRTSGLGLADVAVLLAATAGVVAVLVAFVVCVCKSSTFDD